jgi:hypothetical protein
MRRGLAVALVLALGLGAGCTLFSGWSDLQGGKRPSDAAAQSDAPPTGGDAGGGGDADAPGQGVLCGAKRCAATGPDDGCCIGVANGPRTCDTRQSCFNGAGIFARCTSRRECTAQLGAGAYCCFSQSARTAECATKCDLQYRVCDPTEPNFCPASTSCATDIATGLGFCK